VNPMEGYNITTIPVKRKKYTGAIRTAIYCRVSSAKKAQIESLSAQISGLTSQIAYRPDHVLVDVYIDVAPGDTLKGRPGFQRMLSDLERYSNLFPHITFVSILFFIFCLIMKTPPMLPAVRMTTMTKCHHAKPSGGYTLIS